VCAKHRVTNQLFWVGFGWRGIAIIIREPIWTREVNESGFSISWRKLEPNSSECLEDANKGRYKILFREAAVDDLLERYVVDVIRCDWFAIGCCLGIRRDEWWFWGGRGVISVRGWW